jgi:chorismate-pyruvate lyase
MAVDRIEGAKEVWKKLGQAPLERLMFAQNGMARKKAELARAKNCD